jgi:hypothetical protein
MTATEQKIQIAVLDDYQGVECPALFVPVEKR